MDIRELSAVLSFQINWFITNCSVQKYFVHEEFKYMKAI